MFRDKIVESVKNKIKLEETADIVSRDDLIYKGNYKCHLNCLSYAIKHSKKVKNIVGGIQVFNDDVVAHFVIELKTGEFIDVTYGNVAICLYTDFVIVKRYDNFNLFDAGAELHNLKDHIYNLVPFHLKMFTKNTEF